MFNDEAWFQDLEEDLKKQIILSYELYDREIELQSKLSDYSFIIFPTAKAYEGFLKAYFFKLGLISLHTYEGTRFRIGKSLNPDIHPSRQSDDWVYGDLNHMCGPDTAKLLWQTWLECRNRVFHYYIRKEHSLSLTAAKNKLDQLIEAIKAAYSCEITSLPDDLKIVNESK